MATKRGKASANKRARKTAKVTKPARPAAAAARAKAKSPAATAPPRPRRAPGARPAAAARAASPGPTLLEQAEQLRDDIQRSKLCHPDPWAYTAKARAWGQRAQALVERIAAAGEGGDARQALERLRAEVEADRDFQEARRLF